MSTPLFEFSVEERGQSTSTFDPKQAYANFIDDHREELTLENIRVFLLRANEAKQKLRKSSAKVANLKFGTWKVLVVNNHYPANSSNTVADGELTLHRISGFIAKYLLELYADPENRPGIEELIVNPIAESRGVSWSSSAKVYLSFLPGTEMFLHEFEMLPLAIYIYRAQKGEIDASLLKKPLRQQYKNDSPDKWMKERKVMIQGAVARISKLAWGSAGLSAQAKEFLKEFGISMK
ncbi:N [Gumbo Limbo virus]|uniref:Nucleoprotein n=1 Tax=Gumbo Limbo virus TaxID=348010 RepID=A0A0H3VFQ7_9VIRU|nr:N [Gumbo Limbo virus] [Gumbo Limbo virus]AKB96257.1 nucleoprotein [Gumbo Limbo virus]QLA46955.1 N [Gumbo Limbo virus] [Gumbo Limbo virus]